MTHRTSWPESTSDVVGDQRYLVSIALQKEANATLVWTKQVSMLLSKAHVTVSPCEGAIKHKVLLVLNSIHAAMATNALSRGWFHLKFASRH